MMFQIKNHRRFDTGFDNSNDIKVAYIYHIQAKYRT